MPHDESDQDDTGAQNALSKRDLKKQLKEMRKDIKLLQKRTMEAEEGRVHAEKEKEALQAQTDEGNLPLGADNVDSRASNLSPSQLKEWKAITRTAGARAAALYDPFLDVEPLAGHQVQSKIDMILDDVKRVQEADEELDAARNPAVYWKTGRFGCPLWVDMSREMIFHLPKSPGKMWLEVWFQHEVGEGARKQRSALVHFTAVFYEKIFGFVSKNFKDHELHPNIPQVQALQNFLHINEKDDEGNPSLEFLFMDKVIVRVLRLLLFGQSAIETGRHSPKARKAHAKQWHIKHITPSLLAFAATAIQYVLSGDGLLEVGSGSIDYPAWYRGHLQILKGVYERFPDTYKNIMAYYNKEVFGIDPQIVQEDNQDNQAPEDETIGLDEDDLEFMEFIGA